MEFRIIICIAYFIMFFLFLFLIWKYIFQNRGDKNRKLRIQKRALKAANSRLGLKNNSFELKRMIGSEKETI